MRGEIEIVNQKIFTCLFADEEGEEETQLQYESCLEYDDVLAGCISKLKSTASTVPTGTHSGGPECSRNSLKLTHVPLPEYGKREGEDLNKFFSNFQNAINKYHLSAHEKFVYLQRQRSNEPLTIIKSVELGKQTYEDAKDLPQRAFACTIKQQYRTMKQLSELKMSQSDDPCTFISNRRMISESFTSLEINTDVVLQYFYWHAMNDKMQQQFVHITTTSKPNLEQIKEHTFEAAERYVTQ